MRPTFALLAAVASLSTVSAAPSWSSFGLSSSGDAPVKTMNSWSFLDCGLPTDIVQIESLTVSPDPPEPGQNLTITAVGRATKTIEDGAYADVTVKLGLVKLLQKRFNICEEAKNADADVQCPVDEGRHTVVQTVELPKEIPRAKFVVQVRAFSADDEDLLCADIKVDFMKRPF